MAGEWKSVGLENYFIKCLSGSNWVEYRSGEKYAEYEFVGFDGPFHDVVLHNSKRNTYIKLGLETAWSRLNDESKFTAYVSGSWIIKPTLRNFYLIHFNRPLTAYI